MEVDVALPTRGLLELEYGISGEIGRVRIPDPADPGFELGLWEHTCFELFVAADDERAYHELNLAPSRRWAALAFSDYRSGRPKEDARAPAISWSSGSKRSTLRATIDLTDLSPEYGSAPLVMGISAVLEDEAGGLTYWALAHPAVDPDFHHRDGFIFRVEARPSA